ncbi:dTDP-4-dehydrorhamnose reductase [Sneathiella glossodoripedis]|uniref:dTDP-4-dehydrorhamnose reductase n=1 Tax=Sneathiella glossodoripedis TaxID=418853 RepID=UPI000472BF45|nr:dTDP-4-dehydrorhamnose reductase [Sneathiella glossodoripedis]
MRILLTGAGGQVGQEVVRAAKSTEGIEVIACDRAQLDITDKASIERQIEQHEPHCIVNAAAYTAVDRAEEDVLLAEAINAKACGYLAGAAAKADIPLIHISTDFVFDGQKSEPYVESDPCAPLSVYGKSKRGGEVAIAQLWARHIILRTAWVFGGKTNFAATMRRLAKERSQISVVDDQVGGPTPARHIASALLTIAQKLQTPDFNEYGIYHFTGAPFVSWYEFACEILKDEAVELLPIPTSAYPVPAKRPANSRLNCDRIKRVFAIDQPDWRAELHQKKG